MITEAEVRQAALRGLQDQLRSMLAERRWGAGERLEKFVAETIQQHLPLVEAQVAKALMDALQSPEFTTLLQTEILQALRKKFSGAFDGVMHAAGKKAAQENLLRDAIVQKVVDAVGYNR